MTPDDLKKKLQARIDATHSQAGQEETRRETFGEAIASLTDTIKSAFKTFLTFIPDDHHPRVAYNEQIMPCQGRRPTPHNGAANSIATFWWGFGATDPKLGRIGVGYAPIHIVASYPTETIDVVAWDYRVGQDKYVLCASMMPSEVSEEKIHEVLSRIADNAVEYRPPNAGLR